MDLIDRQDAIDAIMGKTNDSIVEAQAIDILCDLPSAQQWTPISERMPEESGKYLVCGGDKTWICDFMCLGITCGWCNDVRNPRVEAWMPLPEPYREEAENAQLD